MDVLGAALDAANRGWPTFRLSYRQKIPLPGSRGFHAATTDVETLRQWFASGDMNIGLATGGRSRLLILDIDGNHGGFEAIESLQGENGALPQTATVRTGSGWHLYFRMPDGMDIPPSAGKVGVGIDIRGTGGYVVYPPSIHPNGHLYAWAGNTESIAPAPEWIVDRTQKKPTATEKPKIEGSYIPLGQRNQAATRVAGFFRRFGFDSHQIEAQLRILPFEEPLADSEIRLIAWSISRYSKEHDFSGSEYNVDITNLEEEM